MVAPEHGYDLAFNQKITDHEGCNRKPGNARDRFYERMQAS